MSISYPDVNAIAIVIAAVAQFALGWLWYAPMTPTGKAWLAAMGRTRETMGRPGAEMAIFPIGSLLSAWAIAMVYAWAGGDGVADGILAAMTVAVAVVFQQLMQGVAMGTQSKTLAVINNAYIIVGYAVMGTIISVI